MAKQNQIQWITTTEAARILNVTRRWVVNLINEGKLRGRKWGRDWQVDRDSVETYRQQN